MRASRCSPPRSRRVCEQAHQQSKAELGLDHFEGRSNRHALMTLIAYALPAASKQQDGKKESADHRNNQAGQLLDKPFLTSSRGRHPADVLTVRSCSQRPSNLNCQSVLATARQMQCVAANWETPISTRYWRKNAENGVVALPWRADIDKGASAR